MLLEPSLIVSFLLLLELLLHQPAFLGSKMIPAFLRRAHPLLSFVGLLGHVHHPLLHQFVLLLLTLESIRLVSFDRINQSHHRLLHFLLIVQQQLEHLQLLLHRCLHGLVAGARCLLNVLLVVNLFDFCLHFWWR